MFVSVARYPSLHVVGRTQIAIDDTPSKHARSYGNLITVREFVGDRADAELPLLERYLQTLLPSGNVRSIEKRRWREQVAPSGADRA